MSGFCTRGGAFREIRKYITRFRKYCMSGVDWDISKDLRTIDEILHLVTGANENFTSQYNAKKLKDIIRMEADVLMIEANMCELYTEADEDETDYFLFMNPFTTRKGAIDAINHILDRCSAASNIATVKNDAKIINHIVCLLQKTNNSVIFNPTNLTEVPSDVKVAKMFTAAMSQ